MFLSAQRVCARGLGRSLRVSADLFPQGGPSKLPLRSLSLLASRPQHQPVATATGIPFFTPSRSRLPFFFPSSSFPKNLPRLRPQSTAATSSSTLPPPPAAPEIPRSLPIWLFSCSALVFGIIVIGGLTRLTESGLSIVEWQPITGILPPITKEEWEAEWEKYKVSPEGIMMNSKIDMHEFKKIFYMEWGHRIAGRTLGLLFVIPTIYYVARYKLPRGLPAKLALIGAGIGFQGVLGWWMVKSGLDQQIVETNSVPRVSQYRLAAHLCAALVLYIGIIQTAISLRRDTKFSRQIRSGNFAPLDALNKALSFPAVRKYKGLIHTAGMMVFFTAISGAFVAGLDAGLVYNEFPTMGGRLVPPSDELFDPRYAKSSSDTWWRNLLENPVTAQFDHRLLATSTFAVLLALPFVARRLPIPRSTRRLANLTAAAAVTQVTLGITTLLYLVPIPLAAMHQAGSVVLLTCIMALGGSLRKPSKVVRLLRR